MTDYETTQATGKSRESGLFRSEVYDARKVKNEGRVNLLPSISWQIISVILLTIFAGGIAFVTLVPLARTEVIEGTLWPHGKPVSVDSPIEGTITSISVREGDVVQEGDGLVTVTDLTAIGSRGSAAQVVSEGIEARRSLLIDEMAIAGRNAEQAEVERRSRIGALQSSRVATQDQIVRQQKLLANARENLNVAREVAKNGFLSRQDLSKGEEAVLAREQVLSQLRQEIVDTDAKIAVERAGLRRDVATYETRLAALRASRESLGQESAQTERISRVKLIAPISGRIGAAWLSKGQRVAAGEEILLVAQNRLEWLVELRIPASAIARIKQGQSVELRVASFPYQQHGTVAAQIVRIATVPERSGQADQSAPLYRAFARLDKESSLLSSISTVEGMELQAVIRTGSATILDQIMARRAGLQL